MRNEDGAKAGAKIVDYTTIIPQKLRLRVMRKGTSVSVILVNALT